MLDQGRDESTTSFQFSDGIRHRTQNSSTRVASKKSPKTYNNRHELNDVDLQSGTKSTAEDDSGICSPPLWFTSPRMSPQHRRNYYRCLSPTSKTQAIARGQKELMEMVKNMPESNYELSLKDLVENPKIEVGEEKNLNKKESGGSKKGNVKRNEKIESGGFYLKMVFPIPVSTLGGKKKNKKKKESSLANNNSSKVSPRTSVSDGSGKSIVDKEWWKKKSFSRSVAESESGVSSINSGSMKSSGSSSINSASSSRSNSRHEISASSCWPFIRRPESPSQK